MDSAVTLAQVFQHVPPSTGFDVEVKYPSAEELQEVGVRVVDRGGYVDTILAVTMREAKGRKVFFSSFDPDVCWLLAHKQAAFPVLLLTEAGTALCADPRRNSLRAAVKFASAHSLAGVVSECDVAVRSPRVVASALGADLLLFTYGKRNNDAAAVAVQVAAGVHGVVVDHVAHIAKALAR
ncbi:GDE1 [Symbiodinium sp. KB8]|nr:GDE1 [Symbiodinium sp. KB8]